MLLPLFDNMVYFVRRLVVLEFADHFDITSTFGSLEPLDVDLSRWEKI